MVIEREKEIEILTAAYLSREHVFLYGKPGTGKSLLARAFAEALGLSYFEYLLTKYSTPEELFGMYDIGILKSSGKLKRNTAGKLPAAEIAFLDEVWKANSAILNSLLAIINERVFHDGDSILRCPLRTLITASNEIPDDDSLLALYDRILFRVSVNPLSDDAFMSLLSHPNGNGKITLDRSFLDQYDPNTIVASNAIVESFVLLRRRMRDEGIYVSDRRYKKAFDSLKAFTYLRGRSEVEPDDMLMLEHVLWHHPEDIGKVRTIIASIADRGLEQAMALLQQCEDLLSKCLAASNEREKLAIEALAAIRKAVAHAKRLKLKKAREEEVVSRLTAMQEKILNDVLGIQNIAG